jgi:hypothetical protein
VTRAFPCRDPHRWPFQPCRSGAHSPPTWPTSPNAPLRSCSAVWCPGVPPRRRHRRHRARLKRRTGGTAGTWDGLASGLIPRREESTVPDIRRPPASG